MNGGPDLLFVETLKSLESLMKYPSWIVSGLERKTDLEEKFFEEERNCKTVNESGSGLTSLSLELEGLVFVLKITINYHQRKNVNFLDIPFNIQCSSLPL